MSDFWGEYATSNNGSYFKFSAIGDEIEGTVEALGRKTWDDGSVSPTVTINGQQVTASNVDLKRKLSEHKPAVGDHLRIKLVAEVPNKHGGKSRVFDVTVRPVVAADTAPPF